VNDPSTSSPPRSAKKAVTLARNKLCEINQCIPAEAAHMGIPYLSGSEIHQLDRWSPSRSDTLSVFGWVENWENSCWTRKRRCDGAVPICGGCTKRMTACVYLAELQERAWQQECVNSYLPTIGT